MAHTYLLSNSVEKELSRLLKNQDRRQMRELQGKGKGKKKKNNKDEANPDASPADPASIEKVAAGTTRKCANCGQVGHIKTNKRYWHPCTITNTTLLRNPSVPGRDFVPIVPWPQMQGKTILWT